jgi:hypothetical protein
MVFAAMHGDEVPDAVPLRSGLSSTTRALESHQPDKLMKPSVITMCTPGNAYPTSADEARQGNERMIYSPYRRLHSDTQVDAIRRFCKNGLGDNQGTHLNNNNGAMV